MKYKSNKIVTAVLAILLVIVIAGAAALVGVLSDGFKDWTKFQPDEQTETPADEEQGGEEELPVLDDEGEEMESGVVHAMPKAMTFRTAASLAATTATQAETYDSVTLSATVKPDNATDKTVDWSVSFVNASSSWANGKTVTDYVTITPTEDGSTTATVQCLQPFGAQIKITVTSRDNENAKAECTVDFQKRVTGATVSFSNLPASVSTAERPQTVSTTSENFVMPYKWFNFRGITPIFGVGTVTPSDTDGTVVIRGSREMQQAMSEHTQGNPPVVGSSPLELTLSTSIADLRVIRFDSFIIKSDLLPSELSSVDVVHIYSGPVESNLSSTYQTKVVETVKAVAVDAPFAYLDVSIGGYSDTISLYTNADFWEVAVVGVTDVTLDDTAITI